MSTVNEELPATEDTVAFVGDEATCNNLKEMMKGIRMLQWKSKMFSVSFRL